MAAQRLAVSIGCPGGIGPEVALAGAVGAMGAIAEGGTRVMLFGDHALLAARAPLVGVDPARLVATTLEHAHEVAADRIAVIAAGPSLSDDDRMAGRFTARGGAAQLAWIDAACDHVRAAVRRPRHRPREQGRHRELGARSAARFLATRSTSAKARAEVVWPLARALTTALVTTHLALARVPRRSRRPESRSATFWPADLLGRLAPRSSSAPRRCRRAEPARRRRGPLGSRRERDVIAPGSCRAARRSALGSPATCWARAGRDRLVDSRQGGL